MQAPYLQQHYYTDWPVCKIDKKFTKINKIPLNEKLPNIL